ncbi:MAG TPA: YdcF family protein [Stellaceae bacterium]|jgi:uncharacterized SAM-binding protein YcdF (DUF218 family)|nr:YdcF family protein [Stellaceae bacterium]
MLIHWVSSGVLSPPALFITLALAGALLALVWRRGGIALVLLSSLCLYACATPALSTWLLRQVEGPISPPPDFHAAQAIIVLGGDVRYGDNAGIPDVLGPLSLERVAYAAQAYRELHLPVIVSGGNTRNDQHQSEAALMKAALETDFGVPVRWVENRSRTTWENAAFLAPLLHRENLTNVILVSQAWHLPRAVWTFERIGLTVLPWPMPRTAPAKGSFDDFLPSVAALHDTSHALHEMLGDYYYRQTH